MPFKTYGFNLADINKSNHEMSIELNQFLQIREQDNLLEQNKLNSEPKPRKKFLGLI